LASLIEKLNKAIILWLYKKPIAYNVSEMAQVTVRKDLVYKTTKGFDLKLDVYYPPNHTLGKPLPAVVLMHGNASPNVIKFAKDWGHSVSWGRAIAAAGLIAVTYNHHSIGGFRTLPEAAEDLQDALDYVRDNAATLDVNRERIGLFAFSAAVPIGLRFALKDPPGYIHCAVAYYGAMSLQHLERRLIMLVKPEVLEDFSPLHHITLANGPFPPMLVVRAGLDGESLNETIGQFVAAARERQIALEFMDYHDGQHSFELLDKSENSLKVISYTLDFLKRQLL
jgi:acetyl esterase/lipase